MKSLHGVRLSVASLSLLEKLKSPGGPVVQNLPINAGDMGSIPGPGKFHMPWSN